jgi:hypothetical protein
MGRVDFFMATHRRRIVSFEVSLRARDDCVEIIGNGGVMRLDKTGVSLPSGNRMNIAPL